MNAREKTLKAYHLLTTDDIDLHMEGLCLLEEARKEDYEEVLKVEWEISQYKFLQITSIDPKTTIYLTDTEENLVSQANGQLDVDVAPGTYVIHFGLKGYKKTIQLTKDTQIHEEQ